MKVYVCPCGPELSIWRSHDNRYGYIVSSRLGGGGLDSPVWSTSFPVTVNTDAKMALFVLDKFTNTLRHEVVSVVGKKEAFAFLYGKMGGFLSRPTEDVMPPFSFPQP